MLRNKEPEIMKYLSIILSWLDTGKARAAAIFAALIALVFVSGRAAVKNYKDETDEDADRRARAAHDAAADALRLDPNRRHERMREKGWFRD